jgi:hypothetical protein
MLHNMNEIIWSFSCFRVFVANLLFATEARKHGITPKNLKKKAFVGFSALVAIFFLPQKHGTCAEPVEATRNYTKKSQKEGFCGF